MLNHNQIRVIAVLCLGIFAFALLSHERFAQAGSQESAPSTPKIATVDALSIVARMLESDAYKQPNLAHAEKFDSELRKMLQELESIRNRALAEPENAETRKALEAEFVEKNTKFEQARATAQQAVEQFNADQVSEAYRLVCEAANALSQTAGYSHVFVSRMASQPIKSNTVAGAVQEMLARPLVRNVPADDLTEQLVRSFKLDAIAIPGESQQAPKESE